MNGTETADTAEILKRLHALPPEANFTPTEASIYLNVRQDLLRSWRWQGRGPLHVGSGHFIRYPKHGVDAFLAGRPEAA